MSIASPAVRMVAGLLLAWSVVPPSTAAPPSTTAPDGQALLRQVDRNLQPPAFESHRRLINVEPSGRRREFALFTIKKGAGKVLAIFLAPASDKGRSTLRLGDNMWLFVPNVGKPIRITSLQSVTGGVFNNADILALSFDEEYTVGAVAERADGYALTLRARHAAVAYDRLEMLVDRKSMTPTAIACHAASGMLIKTLRFKDVRAFGGGISRPAVVETDSPLQPGYRSIMIYAKLRARTVPDEVFTLNFLPRAEELLR